MVKLKATLESGDTIDLMYTKVEYLKNIKDIVKIEILEIGVKKIADNHYVLENSCPPKPKKFDWMKVHRRVIPTIGLMILGCIYYILALFSLIEKFNWFDLAILLSGIGMIVLMVSEMGDIIRESKKS